MRPKVLVVDDFEAVIWYVRRVLKENVEVLEARTLQEARTVVRSEIVDLLICDALLGDEDGCIFAAEFQAQYPETPIIIISAYVETPCTAVKVAARLSKPFSSEELRDAVRSAFTTDGPARD